MNNFRSSDLYIQSLKIEKCPGSKTYLDNLFKGHVLTREALRVCLSKWLHKPLTIDQIFYNKIRRKNVN